MKEVIFLSRNEHKISEATTILKKFDIQVVPSNAIINEIQTNIIEDLVREKTLKAFQILKNKVFVEHTLLEIDFLNGLPGVHTQLFWDTLKKDKLIEISNKFDNKTIKAITHIGYCDGKKIHYFKGEINGTLPHRYSGNDEFQWDCVFIPKGYKKTFGEMESNLKNSISMRFKALKKFANHFNKEINL